MTLECNSLNAQRKHVLNRSTILLCNCYCWALFPLRNRLFYCFIVDAQTTVYRER